MTLLRYDCLLILEFSNSFLFENRGESTFLNGCILFDFEMTFGRGDCATKSTSDLNRDSFSERKTVSLIKTVKSDRAISSRMVFAEFLEDNLANFR